MVPRASSERRTWRYSACSAASAAAVSPDSSSPSTTSNSRSSSSACWINSWRWLAPSDSSYRRARAETSWSSPGLFLIAFTHDEKGTQIGMEVPKRCANALKHGAGASRSKVNARNSMLLPVPGSPITRQGPSLDAIHSIAGLR